MKIFADSNKIGTSTVYSRALGWYGNYLQYSKTSVSMDITKRDPKFIFVSINRCP